MGSDMSLSAGICPNVWSFITQILRYEDLVKKDVKNMCTEILNDERKIN